MERASQNILDEQIEQEKDIHTKIFKKIGINCSTKLYSFYL